MKLSKSWFEVLFVRPIVEGDLETIFELLMFSYHPDDSPDFEDVLSRSFQLLRDLPCFRASFSS